MGAVYDNVSNVRKPILQLDIGAELNHGIKVGKLAYHVGKQLNLSEEICRDLSIAGVLHDVGKLKLTKYVNGDESDPLVIEELKYVRMHSQMGYEALKNRGFSDFVLESILYHHENYDGSGYPTNKSGEEIPLGARIIRVCDAYGALVSDRPYRRAFDSATAVEYMIEEVKNFDMRIFLAFQSVLHKEDFEVRDLIQK